MANEPKSPETIEPAEAAGDEPVSPSDAPDSGASEGGGGPGASEGGGGPGASEGGGGLDPARAAAEPDEDHEGKLARDLDELEAKAEKADEYLELAQRTKADFENFRKRAMREAAAAQDRGVAKLAKELLPAVDNLDRALEAAAASDPSSANGSPLADGIKLVHADVISALKRVGIEAFSPEGEQFDPQQHEAVAHQPVDGAQAGTVVEVYQCGYKLGDSVLRPARVLVAA